MANNRFIFPVGGTPESVRAQLGAVGPAPEPGSVPAPAVGEVLTWDGAQWVPGPGGGGGGGVTSVTASAPLASSGGATPDISVSAGTTPGDVMTWDGANWAGAAPAGGVWSKTGTELSPATAGDTVQVEIAGGTAGLTVEDTPAALSSEVRPAVVYLTDNNVKIAEVSATGASLLLRGDSGEAIPVIPTITAQDYDSSPTPLDLVVGELRVNGAPGAAGEVLTSNGPGAAPTWQAGGGGIPIATSQYVVAVPGDDLAAQYAAAVALQGGTPSATSRSALVVFPGTYTLSAPLSFGSEYVDVIGLGSQPQRPSVRVEGDSITVSANDVRVEGIGTALSLYVGDNLPLQVFTNCKGEGPDSFGGSNNITGTFIDCAGADTSFAGLVSSAGTFVRCSGGYAAFGFDATGYFEDCSSTGQYAFGGGALASGTFLRCTSSGVDTFGGGGGGTASGTFTSCVATGANSFGASGYASGKFTACQALGPGSFGGGIGGGAVPRGCSGVFDGCIGGLNSFGNSGAEISGQLYGCRTLYGLFGNGETTSVIEYQTVAVTPGTPALFTTASPHGYSVGNPIRLTTTGTPPTGMFANQTYFVASASFTPTTFTLVTFPESIGTPPTVDATDAGTGTQTVTSGRLVNCIDGYNEAVTV